MSDEWRIEDAPYGYALHDPSGRVVGVLHDAEAAITVLRSLNHLEALEYAALDAQPTGDAAEDVLRRRVQALRPALQLALRRLRDVYPVFEQHHEGGEIQRAILLAEAALTVTAGPTTAAATARPQEEPAP